MRFSKTSHGYMLSSVLTLLLGGIALIPTSQHPSAKATVEYARKENKPCSYCHVSAAPGIVDPSTGKLNPVDCNERGFYYETHNHSFAGYVENVSVNSKALTSPFTFGWALKLPVAAQRLAVADVKGDGRLRLVTLSAGAAPSQATLTLWMWDKDQFTKEDSLNISADPTFLQVGRFAGPSGPMLLVTAEGVRWWNGKQFAFLPAPAGFQLIGAVQRKNGEERLLACLNGAELQAYHVDLNAQGSSWLTDPQTPPQGHEVEWAEMHASPSTLEKIGVPPVLSLGGMLGLWDILPQNRLYLYLPKVNPDIDTVPDPKNPGKTRFVLKSQTWCVGMLDASDANSSFFTPPLAGPVHDIVRESPKENNSPGLLVLTALSTPNESGLYFFPLAKGKP